MSIKENATANKKKKGGKSSRTRMVCESQDGTREPVEHFNTKTQRLRAEEALCETGFMGPVALMRQHHKTMASLGRSGIRRLGGRETGLFKRIGKNR